jgi:beta-lactamase regulating signal transducer with metallopeptidase domain
MKFSPRKEASAYLKEKWEQEGKKRKINHLPEVLICEQTPAPMLMGLLRPRLLLPHEQYSGRDLEFILNHELIHLKRADLWYKLVITVANCLHWFNPLVYLMANQAEKDAEMACDEELTENFCDSELAAYGNTILNALPRFSRQKGIRPVLTTSFSGAKKSMKRRLENMFDKRIKRRGIAALCVIMVFAVALCGFFTYVPAAENETENNEYKIDSEESAKMT